jgi:hypothetical protein
VTHNALSFDDAKIGGDVTFDGADINGGVRFHLSEIKGEVSFENTTFTRPAAQEEACRKAKQSWDVAGDRIRADKYFYREMAAKRKQKSRFWRTFEWPLQYFYGYGVHPERLFAAFVVALLGFSVFYWAAGVYASSFLNSLRFSFTTLMIPGSGLLNPLSGLASVVVIIEALFGLLVWGTFIATLARKYGR